MVAVIFASIRRHAVLLIQQIAVVQAFNDLTDWLAMLLARIIRKQ